MHRSTLRRPLAATAAALALLVPAACGSDEEGADASPTSLKLGVPPGEADPELLDRFQAVADVVADGTGLEVEVTKTSDYLAIVEAMRSGLLDVAAFSPFPTVLAQDVAGVQPLVAATGAPYKTFIVCSPDADVESLEDVEGHSFAFVDAGSTSGNYIPRLMLKRAGVDPDELDSTFAGGHDTAALAVQQGSTDCAAVASMLWERLTESGTISADDAVVVAESDPLPISLVIIARKGLDPEITDAITEAFVESQDEKSLEVVQATEFLDADEADFSLFEEAARELGVDLEEVE